MHANHPRAAVECIERIMPTPMPIVELLRLFHPETVVIHISVAEDVRRARLFASVLRLCSFNPRKRGAQGAALPFVLIHRRCPVHVTPIQADEQQEKIMSIVDWALLMNAIAHLLTAAARLATSLRRR
jgi:hypothetical protein